VLRGLLAIGLVILVTACATNKTQTLDEMMQSWVGLPIQTVTKRIGEPDRVQQTRSGGAVYSWVTPIPKGDGTIDCVQQFQTDRNGEIIKWGYTDCPKDGWEQMGYN